MATESWKSILDEEIEKARYLLDYDSNYRGYFLHLFINPLLAYISLTISEKILEQGWDSSTSECIIAANAHINNAGNMVDYR